MNNLLKKWMMILIRQMLFLYFLNFQAWQIIIYWKKIQMYEVIDAFIKEFEELFDVLGLHLKEEELLDEEIEALIEQRIQARKDRNFQLSDQIRDQLKEMNIILEDTPQGTRWKRG